MSITDAEWTAILARCERTDHGREFLKFWNQARGETDLVRPSALKDIPGYENYAIEARWYYRGLYASIEFFSDGWWELIIRETPTSDIQRFGEAAFDVDPLKWAALALRSSLLSRTPTAQVPLGDQSFEDAIKSIRNIMSLCFSPPDWIEQAEKNDPGDGSHAIVITVHTHLGVDEAMRRFESVQDAWAARPNADLDQPTVVLSLRFAESESDPYPEAEASSDLLEATEAVILVIPKGDPGKLATPSISGSTPPLIYQRYLEHKNEHAEDWDLVVHDGGFFMSGEDPPHLALVLWWAGKLVPESWDRACRSSDIGFAAAYDRENKALSRGRVNLNAVRNPSFTSVVEGAQYLVAIGLGLRVGMLVLEGEDLVEQPARLR